ncbi:hypothetical protein PSEUBRA_002928 [Kalmanozyma brasiliensis GHG001]|uniref:uncharacterized protein n=1 Tax=Kalmanozyma brasiliensis (strain GHG001) TaxID=1365824 RepID=UPI002867D7A5|nr:uncharacterized protein PSEUBRA_002928 [Kalmanozyma brasiliensis GHG001]KAF6767155.1 hypothetical protein PSEUBRA_002928 [Kalmanozyma brasiliensis GHG001]
MPTRTIEVEHPNDADFDVLKDLMKRIREGASTSNVYRFLSDPQRGPSIVRVAHSLIESPMPPRTSTATRTAEGTKAPTSSAPVAGTREANARTPRAPVELGRINLWTLTPPRFWLRANKEDVLGKQMSFIAVVACNIITPAYPTTQKRYVVLHFGHDEWAILYVPRSMYLYHDADGEFVFKDGTLAHIKGVYGHESRHQRLLKFTETSAIDRIKTEDALKVCTSVNARLNALYP